MDAASGMFSNVFNDFEILTLNPELFLEQAVTEADGFKNAITKKLYDHSVKANSLTQLKANSLSKLLVDGFDEEQVWQQIELQNQSALAHLNNNLSKFNTNGLLFGVKTGNTAHIGLDADNFSDEQSSIEDPLKNEEFESDDGIDFAAQDQVCDEFMETEKPTSNLKKLAEKKSNGLAGKDDLKSSKVNHSERTRPHQYKSAVDDQFFKLSKLEQYLRLEDIKEKRARDEDFKEDEDSEEDEELPEDEDIDLFQDIPSDELDEENESEDEDLTDKKSSRDLMYEDFFDAPESGDESVMNKNKISSDQELDDELNLDKNDWSKSEDELEDEEDDTQSDLDASKASKQISKTPFELEQEKIKQQIEHYEEKMLKPAAWHLTGEVDTSSRPVDALLHLQTDFEMNAKPVIIQDKPLCEKLESMLKMTIKNKAYSDGVKQYKTNDEIIAYKKEVVLEQNKSKKSLAQEYEDMYLKKKNVQEEEENPKHIEIKKLMDSLFPELHALFSHIPKPAIPDIKIVSNLPAITVEEVAPTSVSDVTLLAPEEVKKRTGLVKGMTERTDTDRKRERRKKKLLQKMKQKKREKDNASDKPLSAKAKKQEKVDMLRKLKQHRNTKIASMDGQKIKSSKDFFEKLQDTVNATVKKKKK